MNLLQAQNNTNLEIPKDFIEFNKWIGLPIHPRTQRETKIFEYEDRLFNELKKYKHFIVNKCTGAGITEITLRIMLHAAYHWKLTGNQLAILNGVNLKESSQLLTRLKEIITLKHPELITKVSNERLELSNGKYFKVYPADHVDAIRGQPDLAFVFIDEVAFFETVISKQFKIRNAIERYIPKTDPWILWVSTPNGPQGTFFEIWQEAHQAGGGVYGYGKMEIDYLKAKEMLEQTYIDKMKVERALHFDQEFGCKFLAPVNAAIPMDIIDQTMESYDK